MGIKNQLAAELLLEKAPYVLLLLGLEVVWISDSAPIFFGRQPLASSKRTAGIVSKFRHTDSKAFYVIRVFAL